MRQQALLLNHQRVVGVPIEEIQSFLPMDEMGAGAVVRPINVRDKIAKDEIGSRGIDQGELGVFVALLATANQLLQPFGRCVVFSEITLSKDASDKIRIAVGCRFRQKSLGDDLIA
jgi:hypothetical protein